MKQILLHEHIFCQILIFACFCRYLSFRLVFLHCRLATDDNNLELNTDIANNVNSERFIELMYPNFRRPRPVVYVLFDLVIAFLLTLTDQRLVNYSLYYQSSLEIWFYRYFTSKLINIIFSIYEILWFHFFDAICTCKNWLNVMLNDDYWDADYHSFE